MFNVKRFPHIIRPKVRTVVPSNFLFFDTETKVSGNNAQDQIGKHKLSFGYALAYRVESGKKNRCCWCRFTEGREFLDFACSRLCKGKPLYVYGHNIGFDLTIVGFFELYRKLGISINFWTVDTPPTIFKCKWKGETIIFVDTLNYWQTSLARLGDSVGIPKLEMPKQDAPRKQWDEYCKNDVRVLDAAITKLIKFTQEHRCGSLSLTLAGLSMSAYRHRFMKHDIYIHDRIKVCQMERDAYYGGLVQCFHIGKVKEKKIYNVDITSHYPHVMLGEFPCRLIRELNKPSVSEIKVLLKRYAVIAEVAIRSWQHTFPKRIKGKLCYVSGRFITYLSGPELERAIATRSIHHIRKAAIYDRKRLFRDFVNYFWHVRNKYLQEGNITDSFFSKILLNSLYGKFGQRGASWMDLTPKVFEFASKLYKINNEQRSYDLDDVPIESLGYYSWTPLGCEEEIRLRNIISNVQIKLPINEHHESFPAIAAYVTAYGRERLIELIEIAGKENVFYCDTDSLFTNETGLRRLRAKGLIKANELGKLKIVGTSNHLLLRGLKDYEFANKSIIKGIRKDATQVAPNEYRQLRFEGTRGILRRGGKAYVTVSFIRKKLQRNYSKGTVGRDGRVKPLILREF